MKRLFCIALLLFPAASFAASKEILELNRQLADLTDLVKKLQSSLDEKSNSLDGLQRQTLENAIKAATMVSMLQTGINEKLDQQAKTVGSPVAAVTSKVDTMTSEFSALKESVLDLTKLMQKLDLRIVELSAKIDTIRSPPSAPGAVPVPNAGGSPPQGMQPQKLYDDAMRDKGGGNLDLALQGFDDYLKYFGATDLAPNAQFQVGEIYYQKNDFENAIKSFDLVLERWPENNKTPDAHYMKGMSLLKSGKRTAAGKEFLDVIDGYPTSDAAAKARTQRKALGLSVPAAAPAKKRKR